MTGPTTAGAGSAPGVERPVEVTVRRDDAVLTVTLNRPERLNAVTAQVLADLADLVEEAGDDEDVRVVVLAGAGRAFSSGADLGAGGAAIAANQPPGVETLAEAGRVVRALRSIPQPTIAAVHGPAVGVGCSLALGCDLVVAAESAYFLLPFTSIGLMPDGGATALVPAAIGRARAMGMALVPERVPAPAAHAWGLVYRVVPDGELAATVETLGQRLASGARAALAATKRAVNDASLAQLEPALRRETDGQTTLLASADFAEAVVAFAEKRAPQFRRR